MLVYLKRIKTHLADLHEMLCRDPNSGHVCIAQCQCKVAYDYRRTKRKIKAQEMRESGRV